MSSLRLLFLLLSIAYAFEDVTFWLVVICHISINSLKSTFLYSILFYLQLVSSEETIQHLEMELSLTHEKHKTCIQEVSCCLLLYKSDIFYHFCQYICLMCLQYNNIYCIL